MTIFFKLPPNSGHLSITDKSFKTRRCPLLIGFTVTTFSSNSSERLLLKLSSCLFSLFFSSLGNYLLNWMCEYMKRNSWKFLQIYWRFLTFTWFNEYCEWVDLYMNSLPLRTKVYPIFVFVVGEKEKVF